MATNPETIEDREQPVYRRVIQSVRDTAGSRSTRQKFFLAVAAALGSLAPVPFGPAVALLLVLAAAESR